MNAARTWIRTAVCILALASLAAGQEPDPKQKSAPPPPLGPAPTPLAIYLTWQRDPVTTMTVHWHTDWTEGFTDSVVEYRPANSGASGSWSRATGFAAQMPFT